MEYTNKNDIHRNFNDNIDDHFDEGCSHCSYSRCNKYERTEYGVTSTELGQYFQTRSVEGYREDPWFCSHTCVMMAKYEVMPPSKRGGMDYDLYEQCDRFYPDVRIEDDEYDNAQSAPASALQAESWFDRPLIPKDE